MRLSISIFQKPTGINWLLFSWSNREKTKKQRKSLFWKFGKELRQLYLLPPPQTISCCWGLLSLATWKKYSNMKFWLLAISKFLSDDLILVSFLVRKVGQDPTGVKEGFLHFIDIWPIPHDIDSRQALNSMSYINLQKLPVTVTGEMWSWTWIPQCVPHLPPSVHFSNILSRNIMY